MTPSLAGFLIGFPVGFVCALIVVAAYSIGIGRKVMRRPR